VETTNENNVESEATSSDFPSRQPAGNIRRGLTWTSVIVGVGAAVLQPELIPGIAIGAAIALAPKYLPRLGGSFRSAGRWLRRTSEDVADKERQAAQSATSEAGGEATTHH
jgi:hypothetical protein